VEVEVVAVAGLAAVASQVAAAVSAAAEVQEVGELIMKPMDHSRINAAIAKAESSTSGEIICLVRSKPFEHKETAHFWAFMTALLAPMIALGFGLSVPELFSKFLRGLLGWWWNGSGLEQLGHSLLFFAFLAAFQLIIYGGSWLLITAFKLESHLTPRALKKQKAHKDALEQFRSRGFEATHERTGVMIYCALDAHFVEVIADVGIYQKVDKSIWDHAVGALLSGVKKDELSSGFIEAIEMVGLALSQHFPPRTQNPNELVDQLIEI
jgi:putative membrane protein